MIGHLHKYSIRFNEIGVRKETSKSVGKSDSKDSKTFWKTGVDGVINKRVQIKSVADDLEDRRAASMTRSRSNMKLVGSKMCAPAQK
mmetsp:Transcript_2581/g.3190  ORF Transcript_2581/g.3190 Transcript_2581/m.3190 type:complete len:87 (+) Transcript_2581:2-262(+)